MPTVFCASSSSASVKCSSTSDQPQLYNCCTMKIVDAAVLSARTAKQRYLKPRTLNLPAHYNAIDLSQLKWPPQNRLGELVMTNFVGKTNHKHDVFRRFENLLGQLTAPSSALTDI